MGIYGSLSLKDWFMGEYIKRIGKQPDLGKSCLRLNPNQLIPYDLIDELICKICVADWISAVEAMTAAKI